MTPYKSRKIPGELYFLVEKFIKKLNKQLRQRTIENGMKILEILGEDRSTGIYRQMPDHQELMNAFHWDGKRKQSACNILRIWTKNEETFEKFQENFEIF